VSDTFPTQALDWLVPKESERMLAIGSLAMVKRFRGHKLTIVDSDVDQLKKARAALPGAVVVAASSALLPFADQIFDVVFVSQHVHRLDAPAAIAEFARVLKPGGQLAIQQTVRDDSVPWVRRLAAILRQTDPDAMSGEDQLAGIGALAANRHFPRVEQRDFRMWVPAAKADLLDQVAALPGVQACDSRRREEVLSAVSRLYDSSARVPDPLLLPYKVCCWRAPVEAVFRAPARPVDDGFNIPL
jgi:SAM-dependent methyltransferase